MAYLGLGGLQRLIEKIKEAQSRADDAKKTAEKAQTRMDNLNIESGTGECSIQTKDPNREAGTGAIEEHAIALGYNTTALSRSSVALGGGTRAKGLKATAIGNNSCASEGDGTFAVGYSTKSKRSSVAMGSVSCATGDYCVAIGRHSKASGSYSTAIGSGAAKIISVVDAENAPIQSSGYEVGLVRTAINGEEYTLTIESTQEIDINRITQILIFNSEELWSELYFYPLSCTIEDITREDETIAHRYVFIMDDILSISYGKKESYLGAYKVSLYEATHSSVGRCSTVLNNGNISDMPYSLVCGKYSKEYTGKDSDFTNGDALVVGNGTSHANRSNAFRVTFGGSVHANAEFNSTGADYAEYFEWEDGNPGNEDRIGLFVAITPSGKIKIAQNDDDVIGVVSGISSVVGNAHEDAWNGMYMRDVYGRPLTEEIDVLEETGEYEGGDEEHLGEPVMKPVKHTVLKVNPEYDSSKPYVPRSKRKEWGIVGLLGQLVVNDDGTCVAGQRCTVGEDGHATAGTQWRVIRRLDANHVVLLASFL